MLKLSSYMLKSEQKSVYSYKNLFQGGYIWRLLEIFI